MICKHCGKGFSDEYDYCPYCAEPIKKAVELPTLNHTAIENQVKGSYKIVTIVVAFLLLILGFLPCLFLGWVFFPGTLGNDAFHDEADTFAIIVWVASIIIWVLLRFIYWQITKKSKMEKRVRKRNIANQFRLDSTSICPSCGSHDIKVYREGYNYAKGFWLRTFDVKGGGYVAGMNSNRARCHCMNCGNDWATNYDYRLIDKK